MNRFCYRPNCPVTNAVGSYTACMSECQSSMPIMTSFISRICDVIVIFFLFPWYKTAVNINISLYLKIGCGNKQIRRIVPSTVDVQNGTKKGRVSRACELFRFAFFLLFLLQCKIS